jgi:hypothetical protein
MWRNLSSQREGSAQMIGVVIALLVSIIIGVLIWFKINQSIFTSMGYAADGAPHVGLNLTKTLFTNVNTTANTIWTLFPIVAVVVVAGIILAIVTNFGRGSGV